MRQAFPFHSSAFFVQDNQISALIFYTLEDLPTHSFLQKIHIFPVFYQDNNMMDLFRWNALPMHFFHKQ